MRQVFTGTAGFVTIGVYKSPLGGYRAYRLGNEGQRQELLAMRVQLSQGVPTLRTWVSYEPTQPPKTFRGKELGDSKREGLFVPKGFRARHKTVIDWGKIQPPGTLTKSQERKK